MKTEDEHFEVKTLGKFSVTEGAILAYLYEHPDESIGTVELVRILNPQLTTAEQQRQAFHDIQYGIETLYAERLVTGKIVPKSGKVQHVQLRLTSEGKVEAIKERRRTAGINVEIVLVGGDPSSIDKVGNR